MDPPQDGGPIPDPTYFRRRRKAIAASPASPSRARLVLSRTLIDVLTLLHGQNPVETRDPLTEQIEAVLDLMLEELKAPQSLDSYARRCGLSVSRFSEVFRAHCGASPMAYLTGLRMQRACQLLDTTELRVKRIAEELGYDEPFYFTRVFQKHIGMSPSRYRKSHRAEG